MRNVWPNVFIFSQTCSGSHMQTCLSWHRTTSQFLILDRISNLVNQGLFLFKEKQTALLLWDKKKKLNASHIFTPGLNYCTAQSDLYLNSLRLRFCRSCPAYLAFAVQMQWLVSTTNSASAFQQSSWTNRKSSLSLLIGGTISIIRGLSVGEEKRLQMVCNYCTFFSAAFDLLFFSPLLPFKLFAGTQFGNLAAKSTAICS